MALDFPNSPTTGQQFVSGNTLWQWDGAKWVSIANASAISVGATPPANPNIGSLWFDTADGVGQLFVYFDDGNSRQWIVANSAAAGPNWQIGTGLALNTGTTPNTLSVAPGVTNGSNAAAGQIGEYLSNTASNVAIGQSTATTLVSLALSAGDWDIYGSTNVYASGGSVLNCETGLSPTANSLPGTQQQAQLAAASGAGISTVTLAAPPWRINSASASTVYLNAYVTVSAGTINSYAGIWARRAR